MFTEAEVVQGVWLKIGENVRVFLDRLYPGGRLSEEGLFGGDAPWEGRWYLLHGKLVIEVGTYRLEVEKSAEGTINSGDERVNGHHNARYRFVHLDGELHPRRYQIIKSLGTGKFGEVFLARDRVLGRRVAIKYTSNIKQAEDEARLMASYGSYQFLIQVFDIAVASHPARRPLGPRPPAPSPLASAVPAG